MSSLSRQNFCPLNATADNAVSGPGLGLALIARYVPARRLGKYSRFPTPTKSRRLEAKVARLGCDI